MEFTLVIVYLMFVNSPTGEITMEFDHLTGQECTDRKAEIIRQWGGFGKDGQFRLIEVECEAKGHLP